MSKQNSPVAVQVAEPQGDLTEQNQRLHQAEAVKPRQNKTMRLDVDSNQELLKSQVKTECPETATSASTTGAGSDGDGSTKRLRTNRGKPPKQLSRDYHIPSQQKLGTRKRSSPVTSSSKSRYSAAVGPLKNAPILQRDVQSTKTDQRVTTTVPARHPLPSVVATSSHAVLEPIHSRNQEKLQVSSSEWYSGAMPQRTKDVPRASAPAPVTQAGKLQQQQQHQKEQQQQQPQERFSVDPSYNLCMAVECHRATAQDEDGDTPLHIALSQEEVDIRLICRLVQLIRMAGKSLDIFNDMQQTPLHIAAITGNPAAARILVEHGANPNETDRNGQTAMHNVCANPCDGSRATLYAILRHSTVEVDINKRNYAGFSPMHISVKNGQCELTKLLIEHGGDSNCADANSGWTPLFHAVGNQDTEHVQILLRGNAQVNTQSYSGNTALHVATGRGLTEIVRILMRYGADMSVRNTQKDTPGMVTTDNSMSNILRGVPARSPSRGSSSNSPRYPSPSAHHPTLTNGVMLLPKQTPQLQSMHPQVPVSLPTATTQIRHSNQPVRKNTERSPQGGKEMEVLSNSTKTVDAGKPSRSIQVNPATERITDRSKVQMKDSEDDASSANCRVSVIVAPKSLKRRLIERTECDDQEKGPTHPSTRQVEVQIKKSKVEPRSPGRPAEHINGVLESQLLRVPLEHQRNSQSPSQLEPMDLTKKKEDVSTHVRELAPSSPSSVASSFSLEDEKLRQKDFAEEHQGNEEGSSRVPEGDGSETVDNPSCTSKKDKKKKKTEKLPPKKRK